MSEKLSAFITAAGWTAVIVGVVHVAIPAYGFARFHGWI